MKIILIGNYERDKQESMERFARMLESEFNKEGFECIIWQPKVILNAKFSAVVKALEKWVGYIDKWVLFPMLLKWRVHSKKLKYRNTYFHICDHSNAPYLKYLPFYRTSITCHDVLAIRGAIGHADAYCTASKFGKLLQRWICHHLNNARKVICDSEMTLKQLKELSGSTKEKDRDWRVIHVGLNNDFKPMNTKAAETILEKAEYRLAYPYLLHVGSGLPRKNRKLLIKMLNALGSRWNGNVCFAGDAVDNALLAYAQQLGLSERIISIVKPDHNTLVALYSNCNAFVFPSYSEGFGWPLIEAQACGAPVIASDIQPMPEISGGTALHINPDKPEGFADAFIWLQDKRNRAELITKGFENIKRFDAGKMAQSYLGFMKLQLSRQ